MFNTKWLEKELYSTIRVNPSVKLTTICEKLYEKYNIGMVGWRLIGQGRQHLIMLNGHSRNNILDCMIAE